MWARFTVLSETPIAAAIAGCAIPLSRSNTIWIRCRCASGIFQCNAVFNCRIWRFVYLTICIPESDGHRESYNFPRGRHQITTNSPIQSALEVVSAQIRAMLRVIEETVPVQRIWLDTAEARETPRTCF